MARTSTVKVLIYSQDGFGLGHLRRNLNICAEIKKRRAEVSCLIIADSPVAPFFKLPPNCDFIKIPTIVKVDTGIWRPDRLSMGYRELLAIRSDMIQNAAIGFQPDVFLVDHMPHGALGELAEPLRVLKAKSPHTKIVLGIRDILGAPDVIQRQWEKEGAFDAIAEFYDAVLIYGCADVFDAVVEYNFPELLLNRVQYCGYVCRYNSDSKPIPPSNNGHGHNGKKYILVTGGGGADASFFMDRFIEAARLLPFRFRALITTGPFMHKEQRDLLRQKTQGLPILVSQAGEDSIRYLRSADLVISMAGYNTVSEILRYRKNAIVVPRAGPSAEQSMRTRIMSERGLFSTIHPTNLSAENLSELITLKFDNRHPIQEAMVPNLNGASKVASVILGE